MVRAAWYGSVSMLNTMQARGSSAHKRSCTNWVICVGLLSLSEEPLDEQQQGVAKAKQESQEQQAFGKNQYVHLDGEWFPHELMVYVYQMVRHGVGIFFHHGPTALSCSLPHSCTGVVRSHCISMDRSGSMRWCKTRDSMSGAYLGSSRSTEVVE